MSDPCSFRSVLCENVVSGPSPSVCLNRSMFTVSHIPLSPSIFSLTAFSRSVLPFSVFLSRSHFLTYLLVCSVSLGLHQEFSFKLHSNFALQQITLSREPKWRGWWNMYLKCFYNNNKTTDLSVYLSLLSLIICL